MALEELLQVLRRETEAEAAAILAAARAEAEAIQIRCEADLAARGESFRSEQETVRRSAVELAVAQARRESRRDMLEARERMLARVFARAQEQFPKTLRTTEYQAALSTQVSEALNCLAARAGSVRCHPELAPALAPMLSTRQGVTVTVDASVGSGFKVASEDGTVEIDGTLEGRLERTRNRMKQAVMAALQETP
jgi:vacuolar-type H+-ATPase subunit E/Vma4